MAVGDFNGPVECAYNTIQTQTRRDADGSGAAALCMLASAPAQATAYAGTMRECGYCIDGAVWVTRVSDAGACTVVNTEDSEDGALADPTGTAGSTDSRKAVARAISTSSGGADACWELSCGLIQRPL